MTSKHRVQRKSRKTRRWKRERERERERAESREMNDIGAKTIRKK